VKPRASVTLTRIPPTIGAVTSLSIAGSTISTRSGCDYFREATASSKPLKPCLYEFVRARTSRCAGTTAYDFPAAKSVEVSRDKTVKPACPACPFVIPGVSTQGGPLFADIRVCQARPAVRFRAGQPHYFFLPLFALSVIRRLRPSAMAISAECRERDFSNPLPAHIAPTSWAELPLPVTDGSGRDRNHAARGSELVLSEAGYDPADGKPCASNPRDQGGPSPSRFFVTTTRIRSASRARSSATSIAPASSRAANRFYPVPFFVFFDQRRPCFEFDMIQNRWDQSLSPGNEQYFYGGVRPPTTRAPAITWAPGIPRFGPIRRLLEALDHTAFVSAARGALDRVLITGLSTQSPCLTSSSQ